MLRLTGIIFLLALLSGCNKPVEPIKLIGQAQGTYYSIIYFDDKNRDFQYEIDSILKDFDNSVSLWVPESTISKVNNNDNSARIDRYFTENFMISKMIADETGGLLDITIGPLVKAWGFGYDGKTIVDSAIIDSIQQFIGYKKIDLFKNAIIKKDDRIQLDFNAIAQGYSVDIIGKFLKSKNIPNHLVDIGGEVLASGQKPDGKPWKVGIEKPTKNVDDSRDLKAVIALNNKSVATSGNYRKYVEVDGKRYSHIIDPFSGYPSQHKLLSVTTIYNNTAFADAYATACMIMGLEKAIEFVESKDELEAFFIFSDENGNYATVSSSGFDKFISSEFQ